MEMIQSIVICVTFILSTCDHVQEIFKIHGVRFPKASLVFNCIVAQHIGCSMTTRLCLDGALSSAVHQTSTDLCFEQEKKLKRPLNL